MKKKPTKPARATKRHPAPKIPRPRKPRPDPTPAPATAPACPLPGDQPAPTGPADLPAPDHTPAPAEGPTEAPKGLRRGGRKPGTPASWAEDLRRAVAALPPVKPGKPIPPTPATFRVRWSLGRNGSAPVFDPAMLVEQPVLDKDGNPKMFDAGKFDYDPKGERVHVPDMRPVMEAEARELDESEKKNQGKVMQRLATMTGRSRLVLSHTDDEGFAVYIEQPKREKVARPRLVNPARPVSTRIKPAAIASAQPAAGEVCPTCHRSMPIARKGRRTDATPEQIAGWKAAAAKAVATRKARLALAATA